jgi:septal ring-binding cell division protein DamX
MAINDREKVLEQISSRAEAFGRARGSDEKSFNDWLQAAGEVVPEREDELGSAKPLRPQMHFMPKKPALFSNPAGLFGVLLVMSGVITLLLISYFVYHSIDERMQTLQSNQEQLMAQMAKLETQTQGSAKRLGDLEINYSGMSREGGAVRVIAPAHQADLVDLKAQLAEQAEQIAQLKASLKASEAAAGQPRVAMIETKPNPTPRVEKVNQLIPQLDVPVQKVAPVALVKQPMPAQAQPVNAQGLNLVQSDIRSYLANKVPSHYTLQMMRGADKEAMESFIAGHQLTGLVAILATDDRGVNEYLMLMGDYAALNQAAQVVEGLRKSGVTISPWMRSFGSIQNSLR